MLSSAAAVSGVLPKGRLTRRLHVVSPLLRGEDVLRLQQALDALGHPPGPLDSCYGVATAAAVRVFQAERGLEVDGACGPRTVAALELARAVPAGSQGHGSRPGRKALAEAIKHLGVVERPVNRTQFGEWFGLDGVPWSAIFVSYCFRIGAQYTLCGGGSLGEGAGPRGCAYVPTIEAWLRASGLWVGRTSPRAGDIAIFNWDGRGAPEHIGIVEKSLGGGKFQCLEGNTSLANDSNGGTVMRRTRLLSQVEGFGRVHL